MEYRRLVLTCAIGILFVLPLDGGIILRHDPKTFTGDLSLEKTIESNYEEVESPRELSRQRRATNDTSNNSTSNPTGNSGSGKSAIEEFYSDKHNMAMYLILPLIILVYGGCSCIYCCYKCRRYLRKRIVIYQNDKRIKMLEKNNDVTESSSSNGTKWTAATNEIQFVKSMPNLRENICDLGKRPATVLASYSFSEKQEVDQLLEELAIITEDKPVVKGKKPTAEVTPVVQVRTQPVKRVQSPIKEDPQIPKALPVVVEVKSVVDVNDDNANNNNNNNGETSPPHGGKSKKKSMILSASDIAEIMKYYNNKKHMPNVIPEDSENDREIIRKVRKKKIFSS